MRGTRAGRTVRRDVVDGTYELDIVAQIGAGATWTAPPGIQLRAASVDELAALPLVPRHYVD